MLCKSINLYTYIYILYPYSKHEYKNTFISSVIMLQLTLRFYSNWLMYSTVDLISRFIAANQFKIHRPKYRRPFSIYRQKGTGIPCTRCVSHTGYLAHGNGEGEIRGSERHQDNSKSVVSSLEERNVSTKGNTLKQGLFLSQGPNYIVHRWYIYKWYIQVYNIRYKVAFRLPYRPSVLPITRIITSLQDITLSKLNDYIVQRYLLTVTTV